MAFDDDSLVQRHRLVVQPPLQREKGSLDAEHYPLHGVGLHR